MMQEAFEVRNDDKQRKKRAWSKPMSTPLRDGCNSVTALSCRVNTTVNVW